MDNVTNAVLRHIYVNTGSNSAESLGVESEASANSLNSLSENDGTRPRSN